RFGFRRLDRRRAWLLRCRQKILRVLLGRSLAEAVVVDELVLVGDLEAARIVLLHFIWRRIRTDPGALAGDAGRRAGALGRDVPAGRGHHGGKEGRPGNGAEGKPRTARTASVVLVVEHVLGEGASPEPIGGLCAGVFSAQRRAVAVAINS